jgi:hydroxyacylglutathione hydrolase
MLILVKNKTLLIEKLVLSPYETNTYIVVCQKTHESVLVDAPAEADKILEKLEGTKPRYILLTHNHIDHIGALAELHSRLKVPLAVHPLDSKNLEVKPEMQINDGDVLSVGELKLKVLHTPGHTRGSLCFKIGRYLLAGDTIFTDGPGHTRTPADFQNILEALTTKIFTLPDSTLIYPGHGDSTVLKKEREKFAAFSSRPHDSNLCGDVVWLSS